MITPRKGSPPPELWSSKHVMEYLNCDKETAEKIMNDCRQKNGLRGYGPIEQHLILDFINEKQRIEREREARFNADLANVRQVTVLEEQVKTLRGQLDIMRSQHETMRSQHETMRSQLDAMRDQILSSSKDAQKARLQTAVANFLAVLALGVAIASLFLK